MTRHQRMEEELEHDIADHIAMETDENIARGMPPEEARYAALRKFGNATHVKEDARGVWISAALDAWYADVRQAFRRMRRSPGTAALAVLSLALAFAAGVTVFSVMDRLFLTPVPVKAPEEIIEIQFRDTRPNQVPPFQYISYSDFQYLRRSLRSFSGLTFKMGAGAIITVDGRRMISGTHLVSDDYFSVLGVPLQFGPGFLKDRPSVIVSHAFWMRELAGRRDVIGRELEINGSRFVIGGVASPEFRDTDRVFVADLWVSAEAWFLLSPELRDQKGGTVWARMRPGVSPAGAAAEVESVCRGLGRFIAGYTFSPLAARQKGGIVLTSLAVLLLGILLSVACANVAGILLARAEESRHETAIRQALGASRGRLVRSWMVESAVLSGLAAALGLAGARVALNYFPRLLPSMIFPIHLEFSFGLRVWLYAASLVLVSALAFGLVPAWRGSRPGLLAGLRRDSAISILRVRVPVRSLLIVIQVAAAEVLLFSAGLVLDTVSGLTSRTAGFEAGRPVAIATLAPTGEGGTPRPIDCEAVCERLARIGGVRRVTYGGSVPLSGSGGGGMRRLELPGREPSEVRVGSDGPAFLSTLGVRFLFGGDLGSADQHGVLVNATLARELDPTGSVVGRTIRLDGKLWNIVGVFQDTKWNSLYDPAAPFAITLTPARAGRDITFAIEVPGNPAAYLPVLGRELAAAQPDAMILSFKTLWQHYQDWLFMERTATRVFYGLGGLALLLTVTGLHGITSALFARRSREFGIMLALGAAPRRIMGSVLAGAVRVAACGLAIGLAIAVPVAFVLRTKVPGVSPWSPAALGLSSAIVMIAALAAAAQPASRVWRIDPSEVMRAE